MRSTRGFAPGSVRAQTRLRLRQVLNLNYTIANVAHAASAGKVPARCACPDQPGDPARRASEHLEATGLAGTIAVVACDKPPVGTSRRAVLEHNQPAIIMSDGPIHPGVDPSTGEALDIVSAYQVAGNPDPGAVVIALPLPVPASAVAAACSTYNTMQTFIGVVVTQPLHMGGAGRSDGPRRPAMTAGELRSITSPRMIERGLKAARASSCAIALRNAVIVAHGDRIGSTNVTLHAPEIARAAGYADLWRDVTDAGGVQSPFPICRAGARSTRKPSGEAIDKSDIDRVGGVPVIARSQLDAGLLNGDVATCHRRNASASPKSPDWAPDGRMGRWFTRWTNPTSRLAACAYWAAISRLTSRRF